MSILGIDRAAFSSVLGVAVNFRHRNAYPRRGELLLHDGVAIICMRPECSSSPGRWMLSEWLTINLFEVEDLGF